MNTNCEICQSDSATDSVMWACAGCPRKFHAACVGVPVLRGSLRRNEKRQVDIMSYMLPCCSSCQNLVTANFEFNALVEQQAKLTDQINKNTEVTHRSTVQLHNTNIVHEAIDRLEVLLVDIKKQLTATGSSGSTGHVSAIKNHITSLFDIAMQASQQTISSSMSSMMTGIGDDLKCLNDDMQQIKGLTLDIASPMHNNPMLGLEILDELKSLSVNINVIDSKIQNCTPESVDSLEYELDDFNSIQAIDHSGWRLLGSRNVWKADWTEYDNRKLYRLNQQKQAEKARKRKKQARNNFNNHAHSALPHSTTRQNRRKDYDNNYKHCNNNYNNDGGRNGNRLLPPDRVLLAAAKDRFSKPPPTFDASSSLRPIQFQRGDILNPYPDEFRPNHGNQPNWTNPGCASASSCEACYAQHSCFRRH